MALTEIFLVILAGFEYDYDYVKSDLIFCSGSATLFTICKTRRKAIKLYFILLQLLFV